MADPAKPLVYLILGAADSGRRQLVADLIEGSREPGSKAAVLMYTDEAPSDADSKLPGLTRWKWQGKRIEADWPSDATQIFFITHGRGNPVDQVEGFREWLEAKGRDLARALCVVNCGLAYRNHPSLLGWYEACIHFADVVLLNRREGVENKWMSDFRTHFEKQFLPCLFETVRNGRVRNPALVLAPEARRMSHVFDEEADWPKEAEREEASDPDEEQENGTMDPYFELDAAGRRKKRIPDIARFLDP